MTSVIVGWLNRWRYAFILWVDRVLCRWEYRLDMRREATQSVRERYIAVAVGNWNRWGSWSNSELMRRHYVA